MTEAAPAPGLHGKVPARGDFVSRQVPGPLLALWDGWLQRLVTAARPAGPGTAWRDAWLEAPVWHLAFGAGVLDAAPCLAVLIGSADRAGRCYPFTLLARSAADACPPACWIPHAERLALAALDDDFDADTLAAALRRLGPPACPAGGAGAVPGWSAPPLDADWPDAAGQALAALADGASLCWCRDSPRGPGAMLQRQGLPEAADCARMMLGTAAQRPSSVAFSHRDR